MTKKKTEEVIIDRPILKEYTKNLPVKLTDGQLLGYARDLAQAISHQTAIEQEKSEAVADFKSQLATAMKEIQDLKEIISTGRRYESVECEERVNFEENKVHIIRKDTGEEVDSRVLEAYERQRLLDFDQEEHEQPEEVDAKARTVVPGEEDET